MIGAFLLLFFTGNTINIFSIMGEGLEHHIALTYGDYVPVLEKIAGLLDLPVLTL